MPQQTEVNYIALLFDLPQYGANNSLISKFIPRLSELTEVSLYSAVVLRMLCMIFQSVSFFSSRCVLPSFPTIRFGLKSMFFGICQKIQRFAGFAERWSSTVNSLNQTGNNALCISHSIIVYLDRNCIPPPKFRGSPPRANLQSSSSLTWTFAESRITGLLASVKTIVLLLS